MASSVSLADVNIRTYLQSGDIGYVTYLHGLLYKQEYGYSLAFEAYVAAGLHEFYHQYTSDKNRVFVAEHNGKTIGFLLVMQREEEAQIRYFLITPGFRGIGLGRKLMDEALIFMQEAGYQKAYLWTTNEQIKAIQLYQQYGFGLSEEKESDDFGKPLRQQRYDLVL